MFGEKMERCQPIEHRPRSEAWWWDYYAVEMLHNVWKWASCQNGRKSEGYVKILKENLKQLAANLDLSHHFVFQHNSDSKHTSHLMNNYQPV